MTDEPQDTPVPTPAEPTPANEWSPPASQADLDRIIQDRLARERARYSDYDALREKAQNWDQIEEASKTEYERLQESFEATRKEAEAARADAARYRVAATHGISADHFDLLGSGTEEEITARAEKLAALLAAQTQPPVSTPPVRRPVEQMRPGATPGDAESEDDVLFAQLFGGTK